MIWLQEVPTVVAGLRCLGWLGAGGGVLLLSLSPLPPFSQGLSASGHAGNTGAAGREQGEVAVPLAPLPGHPDSPEPPAMPLRESPFPSRALAVLDRLAEGLLAPSFWATNHLLDLQPTTAERQQQRQRCCGRCRGCTRRTMAGLVFTAVLLLSLPIAVLGLLLWLPVQAARRPFAYQRTAGTAPAEPWDLQQRRTFTFVSANVCLLPNGLAKINNLGQTPQRAAYIARHLAPASSDPSDTSTGLVEPRDGGADGYGGTLHTAGSMMVEVPVPHEPVPDDPVLNEPVPPEPVPPVLSERFPPDADIVCLQEVFDAGADTILRRRLGGTFPHVVSEVGARGLRGGRLRLLGSGLLLASRYPLLAADYHAFPNGAREDALAAKGLLMAQVSRVPIAVTAGQSGCGVLLLRVPRPHRCWWARRGGAGSWATSAAPIFRRPLVSAGVVGNPHPAPTTVLVTPWPVSPAADTAIREDQLTLALGWLQQFREEQEQHGDVVAFDVFCGDLNFDNGSPGGVTDGGGGDIGGGGGGGVVAETCSLSTGDALNQRHRLFEVYQDPCRQAPGQDQPWAIGGT